MNKKSLPLIIILIAIAVGLIYLKSTSKNAVEMTSDQPLSETISEAKKFAMAVESGEPYHCQLSGVEDSTIEYSLKDGKMYMNMVTPQATTYMINDGEYIYSWNNQTSQGTKMAITQEGEAETNVDNQEESTEPPSFATEADYEAYQNQGYSLTCQTQELDDSLFTPPSDISFTDLTQLSNSMMESADSEMSMEQVEQMAKEYEGMMPDSN